MQKLENFLSQNPEKVFFLLLILAVPAFFINLGLLPLFADESTRANVALEMVISGNYAVPTVGGEYYYNKPPFYNWILAGLYRLTGSYSEFITRLPALIPMFFFAMTIYYSVRYFLRDKWIALISGILFMVNGRMLIYDSMLGHIDIFYSWLTFGSFMLIFFFFQKKNWFGLFFVSYLITAISFLCKGLPSIVFQGFTLLALLGYTGNIKKLFSWQHILGGLTCLLIIAAYFFNYYQFNPNLEGYLSTIWDQSSKRTAAEYGLFATVRYMLLFPFEHAMHLLPASLLLLFCFNKHFIKGVRKEPFLTYVVIIFLANIWVYWLSPQTRPRYLLMLYPLIFIVLSHAYISYKKVLPRINRIFQIIIISISILVCLALPGVLFAGLGTYIPYLEVKLFIVLGLCLLFTWLIYRLNNHRIIPFLALLITVRLAFSLFVLPYRAQHKIDVYYKNAAIEMGKLSGGKPFYFFQYHPGELAIPFHDRLIFYIQRTRMAKVKFTEDRAKPGYYFTFDRDIKDPHARLIRRYRELKLYEVK